MWWIKLTIRREAKELIVCVGWWVYFVVNPPGKCTFISGPTRHETTFISACLSNCQTRARARGCAPAAPSFRKSRPTDSTSQSHTDVFRVGINAAGASAPYSNDEFLQKVSVFFSLLLLLCRFTLLFASPPLTSSPLLSPHPPPPLSPH